MVKDQPVYTDFRFALYRIVKSVILIFTIGFIIKFTFCDTYLIDNRQMEPSVLHGDHVLISKLQYASPFNNFFKPKHKDPVIFNHPHIKNNKGCLRIAGIPGDLINIKNGSLFILNNPNISFKYEEKMEEDILPYEFSPRDNMLEYRIPKKNETIFLDSLNIKNLIFLYSIIKQENDERSYSLSSNLYFNDTLNNNYHIKDFSLYTGKFNEIPDSLNFNWFFWDRLLAYLIFNIDKKKVDLKFSIRNGKKRLNKYTIGEDFFFLISDNWDKGFDSRFFGPILKKLIDGKLIAVLWSFETNKDQSSSLRGRRIGKIIE